MCPSRRDLEECGHPSLAQHAGPSVHPCVHRLPFGLGGLGHLRRRPPEEGGEGHGAHRCLRRRTLERLQQPIPVACRGGVEHAPGPVHHRRHAHGGERVAHGQRIEVSLHEHGHVPWSHRPVALDRGARRQQSHDVAGQVGGDDRTCAVGLEFARLRSERRQSVGAMKHPEAQRLADRRAGESGCAARRGLDRAVDDAGMSERSRVEHRVVGVEQGLVAAPVGVQGVLRAGRPRGVEIGIDVGAAEGVDRLLGVADEHQAGRRAVVDEGPSQDVPLDGVSVLELVDQHHSVPRRSRWQASAPRASSARVSRRRVSRSSKESAPDNRRRRITSSRTATAKLRLTSKFGRPVSGG